MWTKLQITPATDLERRLSAVQHRKLLMHLPHGSTIIYLVGSLLFVCLYFIEFLAVLLNVATIAGMIIFVGLEVAAAWALNRYNHQVAAQWKQQTHDRFIEELAAQQLTHHDIDIAELQQLLTRLNVRIIRTSDDVTTPFRGAIQSFAAVAQFEYPDLRVSVTDADHPDDQQKIVTSQIDRADDPLTKFKPGWYMLCRFSSQQQTRDRRLSDPVPVQTVDQLVDVVVRILLSKVRFKRVHSAK